MEPGERSKMPTDTVRADVNLAAAEERVVRTWSVGGFAFVRKVVVVTVAVAVYGVYLKTHFIK